MKKSVLLLAAVFITAYVLFNILQDHTTNLSNAGESPNEKALAVIKDNGCMHCHSVSSEKPFYTSFPPVSYDVNNGIKAFNIDPAVEKLERGEPVSEAVLARIEFAVYHHRMPLTQYKAMHWGSAINDQEKTILLDWVKEARANDYGKNLAAESMKNEPVRPISNHFVLDSSIVALGYSLYHDKRLSANNTVSCATCHDLNKGGVDGLVVSKGIHNQDGGINAPTVFNSAFNIAQFWDGRAADLQEQAAGPPLDEKEMGNKNFDEIVNKLMQDDSLKAVFESLYNEGITKQTITHAIAEFEKTLITPNAPFDQYLMGEEQAITDTQKQGYVAFKNAGCASCHVGEAMGGQSFEFVGLNDDYYDDRGTDITPADHGRYKFTKEDHDKFLQKVPTLRNVALTAPYFHDASAETLKDAVVMMNKYQSDSRLSDEEIDLVVDFLSSLTGEYNGKPLNQL